MAAHKKNKSKADHYVCRVPPGGSRKGCGGGAKVEELDRTIKKLHKRLVRVEDNQKTAKSKKK